MRFHDFENSKQRLIADCREKLAKNDWSSIRGIDATTAAASVAATLQAAHKCSNKEILEKAIGAPLLPIKGGTHELKCRGDAEREHISALSEYEWFQLERPFYNVYPIVEKLVRNTKLQVSAAFLQLPYRTMLFRFPAGHEPYGIKTILLTVGHPHALPVKVNYFNPDGLDIMRAVAATATVQYVNKIADDSSHDVFTLAALFEEELDPKARPYEPRFPLSTGTQKEYTAAAKNYQALQSPDDVSLDSDALSFKFENGLGHPFIAFNKTGGLTETFKSCCLKSIEDTIALQHDATEYPGERAAHPTFMGFQSLDVHQFVFKLGMLVSMLHRGDNLIAPIVLAKHQERYDKETDAAARKWLEDKAAQIQGRGFSVGKELQQRSDISPHFRNPHMALYWTGRGRKEPTLLFRAGADVMLKKLARVPTGFIGPEQPNENIPEVKQEYVYFLREPHTGFVKIGRTSRTVAERKRQLECGVHGLALVGHIVTSDCVELETRLHRMYASKRRRRADGRQSEFFELSELEVQKIMSDCGGVFHKASEN